MEKGFLHLHVTVVVLFMLFFAYKLFLLLVNKEEKLRSFRQKTKIFDMVLGSLILITGSYLLFIAPKKETYLIVKLVLTLAIIPLGIIGMKKENKVLSILTMVILLYVFSVGKTKSLTLKREKLELLPDTTISIVDAQVTKDTSLLNSHVIDQNTENVLKNGKLIYTQVCTACHGVDGKLGVSGAKDLSVSTLSHEEVVSRITNGKGLMQAYEDILSEQEIAAVASYVESLRVK